jgi:hypothetical protein
MGSYWRQPVPRVGGRWVPGDDAPTSDLDNQEDKVTEMPPPPPQPAPPDAPLPGDGVEGGQHRMMTAGGRRFDVIAVSGDEAWVKYCADGMRDVCSVAAILERSRVVPRPVVSRPTTIYANDLGMFSHDAAEVGVPTNIITLLPDGTWTETEA